MSIVLKKPGLVWIPGEKGKVKPFTGFRKIERGKNKGKYEVVIQPSNPKKLIVEASAIRKFPELELTV